MSAKTIFIIIVSVLVTIILMKNTDEVSFWFFGDASIPKLAILGIMFGLGFVIGVLAGRPSRKKVQPTLKDDLEEYPETPRNKLSDEDRDYIT